MEKTNFRSYKTDILLISILFLAALFYFGRLFYTYFNAEMISGWDGGAHYSIAKYYSENIFPKIYGWVPIYYAGMPFPLFYPPLFYIIIAFFSRLFSAPVLLIFKLLIIFLTITFPWLIYWFSKSLGLSRKAAFLSGLLTIHFLSLPTDKGGGLGISIWATFNNGFVTHLLGGWLLFLWLIFFIRINGNKKYFYLSIFLFSAVLLSNAHIILSALVIFFVFALVRTFTSFQKFQTIKNYLLNLIFSSGLVAFWYLPFLGHYQYSVTETLLPIEFQIVTLLWSSLIIFSGLGFWFALRKRNLNIVSIGIISLVLLILTLPIQKLFPGLPIHPSRGLPLLYLFLLILSSHTLFELIRKVQLKPVETFIIYLLFLIPFFYNTKPIPSYVGSSSLKVGGVDQLIEFMNQFQDGRSMVEVVTPLYIQAKKTQQTLLNSSTLSALLGSNNQSTIWTVFRESSLNSPFVFPLMNSFSQEHEVFGIVCVLCGDLDVTGYEEQFYTQSLLKHIKRAQLFNLKYFILTKEDTIETFTSSPDFFEKINQFGDWQVFKLKEDSFFARILDFYPVLVFTQLKTKDRPYAGLDAYDWLRLNEEWFFQADFDIPFALAKKPLFGRN